MLEMNVVYIFTVEEKAIILLKQGQQQPAAKMSLG